MRKLDKEICDTTELVVFEKGWLGLFWSNFVINFNRVQINKN